MTEERRDIPIEEQEVEEAPADEAVATEERETRSLEEDLESEIESLQDRLLRLQAEFDNYRKREARERAAAWGRAKADLVQKLLGAIDDLQRVAGLDPDETAAESVIEGVGLVERKLLEILEREGLEPVGEVGERFDPEEHEAIGVWPAEDPEADGTVAAVVERGYRFGEQLLRPARVQVYAHRPEEADATPA
ncbi:MAG: nucleotide exchange factor GrpE [Gemmatimonadota bacterium]|nr:nucleotide exchange factor GrpE [Gemmatimonadota bacterium]